MASLFRPSGLLAAAATLLATVATAFATAGCPLQDASERSQCDRARARLCGDPAIDCDANRPAVVATLDRCDGDEIFRDRGFHLASCIEGSATYARITAALATSDRALCTEICSQDTACDREAECRTFQVERCGLADGGADAS